jgi:hypothetical protein
MSKKDIFILRNINYKTSPFHNRRKPKKPNHDKRKSDLKTYALFALGKRYSNSLIHEIFFFIN